MTRKLLFALLLGASSPAAADVITFDSLPTGFSPTPMTNYVEDGMTITSAGGTFWSFPDPGMLHLDPGDYNFGNYHYAFTFAGGLFNVTSFDVTFIEPGALAFLEALDANGVVINTLLVDGSGTIGIPGFDGIHTLRVGSYGNHMSIDNVTFTAAGGVGPVPEPGTWGMMLLGFGLTGFALRHSKALRGKMA